MKGNDMEFSIEKKPTVIKYNGEYYPTYSIDLDSDVIAYELRKHFDVAPDDVREIISECENDISHAISDIITRKAHAICERVYKTYKIVRAEITRCMWTACDEYLEGESDYASDCSLILDEEDFDDLPLPKDVNQACADGDMDYIYQKGVTYGFFREWSGPYDVYINEDDYEEYYKARKELEETSRP